MKKYRIIFRGNNISREDFEENFEKFFEKSLGDLGKYPQDIQFYMFLWEVVKNIYDHANGRGEMILLVEGHDLSFVVRDFGKKSFDLEKIKKRGSTKAGNGINFGFGVVGGGINALAKGIGIDLKLDTSRGFRYSGEYRLRR